MKIGIVGSDGLPASYGGFETLVEQLVKYHYEHNLSDDIFVFCSGKSFPLKKSKFLEAKLVYVQLKSNGIMSIFYDIFSIYLALKNKCDTILILGVSGAVIIPLIKLIAPVKIIVNIDGIEWKRQKWHLIARCFLKFSESLAIRFSDIVISDNKGIYDYVKSTYGIESQVIAYGGNHAIDVNSIPISIELPIEYTLSICRIEPENNIDLILQFFSKNTKLNLVIIGNWDRSIYGKHLKSSFLKYDNITMVDPIYEIEKLKTFRENASSYIHGHSAGGTNPSLVEIMHFGIPVLVFDCDFNRFTTDNKALYFNGLDSLNNCFNNLTPSSSKQIGLNMRTIAKKYYMWETVGATYFNLFKVHLINK